VPALDNLVVERHVMHPDGAVELAVRVLGPMPDEAVALLVDMDGTEDGDDVVIERTWPAAMAPPAPRLAMRAYLTDALIAWAAQYAGPMVISERSEIL
jgi:hypothetical protein